MERIINDYHNHFFDSLIALQKLREVARDMQEADNRRQSLGLTEDEEAFYEILASHKNALTDFELIKEIVQRCYVGHQKQPPDRLVQKTRCTCQIMLSVKKFSATKL